MEIVLPPVALVFLCGTSGCGKSTFARNRFAPTEIVSSDRCRAMVLDDEGSQAANEDAFTLLHTWLGLRLKHRRFTVVDSTALKPTAREPLLDAARQHRVPIFALLFDVPVEECLRRDAARPGRHVGASVIARHRAQFEQALRELPRDTRLAGVHILDAQTMETVVMRRAAAPVDGHAFDVIGDVHGCLDELRALFAALGYAPDKHGVWRHPDGRIPVFVGDLADRGPDSPGVLHLACRMVAADAAIFVPGNHDDKLFRMLRGAKVQRTHGLDTTAAQFDALPDAERVRLTTEILALLAPQPPYVVLDHGNLVVAHAGIREEMIGRKDDAVIRFTRFGDVRGFEADGKPIRYDWAQEYRGDALIAYGHTPQETVRFVGNTVNLDGGCVFGGMLAALRYPEREIVTVPAATAYARR